MQILGVRVFGKKKPRQKDMDSEDTLGHRKKGGGQTADSKKKLWEEGGGKKVVGKPGGQWKKRVSPELGQRKVVQGGDDQGESPGKVSDFSTKKEVQKKACFGGLCMESNGGHAVQKKKSQLWERLRKSPAGLQTHP